MNRIILEQTEIDGGGRVRLKGRRALHILKVLKVLRGSSVRVGILDGPRGTADIIDISDNSVSLACHFEKTPPPLPAVDLLLALPRPKVMRRLWPQLAALGVRRIVLTNAEKVERNYFDTHWLSEDVYRPLLIEGLEQSGDTRLPQVRICRRLKPLLEDESDAIFGKGRRLICHPREAMPVTEISIGSAEQVLLAVGPEGGWSNYEIDIFAEHRFDCISPGWRVLRSDTACITLIAAVNARRSTADTGL